VKAQSSQAESNNDEESEDATCDEGAVCWVTRLPRDLLKNGDISPTVRES
jgi:hypothetical protein